MWKHGTDLTGGGECHLRGGDCGTRAQDRRSLVHDTTVDDEIQADVFGCVVVFLFVKGNGLAQLGADSDSQSSLTHTTSTHPAVKVSDLHPITGLPLSPQQLQPEQIHFYYILLFPSLLLWIRRCVHDSGDVRGHVR